jgi:hypothetical protein
MCSTLTARTSTADEFLHRKGHLMTTYRIKKISDPRSRGVCYWFEILAQRGADAWSVGSYDTKAEARQVLAQIKAAEGKVTA